MVDVSVSRPTWVAEEFQPGLRAFLAVLEKMALHGRTLGTTDQPTKCPLDEVIQLVDQCRGAVILGYPQLRATAGVLKDKPLEAPMLLPTEWNHIEAGLAYARDRPLLVVHHLGVTRGIFDRGAISGFLHGVDLASPTWALDAPIAGALDRWKADVLDSRAEATRGRQDGDPVPRRRPLSEELITALQALAEQDRIGRAELGRTLKVPEQKAQYYVDELEAAGLVHPQVVGGRGALYLLERAGRAALVERGLL